MLEELRAWLNGSREYYAGVVLYAKCGSDNRLKALFAKGKTDYCERRLVEELMEICKQLKENYGSENTVLQRREPKPNGLSGGGKLLPEFEKNQRSNASALADRSERVEEDSRNPELYAAAKAEADAHYKEVMNKRAVLFSMANPDDLSDPNTPDRIQQREKLSLEVAECFKKVSILYDKADYVKQHGRLPNEEDGAGEELNPDNIPEHLVKQTLDNRRKNVNKLKKRPQTPERVALIQKQTEQIKQLEARWRLLQPAK